MVISGLEQIRPAVGRAAPGIRNGRVHQGVDFLKQHCCEPICVGDLAKAIKMSKRGMHKAFRRQIGRTPGRELRQMRIERSKQLLVNSDYNLERIAKMCGYRSLNSFWIAFRNIVGESPGKYRSRFS